MTYLWFKVLSLFNRVPSPVTELVSGIVTTSFAYVLIWLVARHTVHTGLLVVVATSLSIVYEVYLDVNGWSWTDVGQRSLGIAVAIGLGSLL